MTIRSNCSELSRFTEWLGVYFQFCNIFGSLQLIHVSCACLCNSPNIDDVYCIHLGEIVLIYISQIRLAGIVTCIFWVSQVVFTTEIEEMDDIQTKFCAIFRIGCLLHYEIELVRLSHHDSRGCLKLY